MTAPHSARNAGALWSSPGPRDPTRPFAVSPFTRLARAHTFNIAGDAAFAIALAGSVFFSLDFDSARWNVALYLLLTIAPFAVAAPFIGPVLDRVPGGRKWMIVGGLALRALLCFFVVRHLDSLLFYPEAFLMLVLGKTYTISKSAVVPTTVSSDAALVEANSKLSVISAIAVVAVAPVAAGLMKLGDPEWALVLAMVLFAVGTVFALQLPQVAVATQPAGAAEKEELRSAGIVLASSAMGVIRGIVGFLAFMLAFDFKNNDAPLWHLGFVAATAQLGFFLGAVLAPRVRRFTSEERIIIGTLVVMAAGGGVTAFVGGLVSAGVLSLIVGGASSMAKQAFDAIVQRDAPDANRGRSFARFETRFQLLWVIGALVPIIVPIPARLGFVFLAAIALFAVGSYIVGTSRVRSGHTRRRGRRSRPPAPPPPPATADPSSARRWVRADPPDPASPEPRVGGWEPPPGFVSTPLGDQGDEEVTTVDEPPSASSFEQPRLPLEDDATSIDRVDDTEVYPEPPWRNAGQAPGPATS